MKGNVNLLKEIVSLSLHDYFKSKKEVCMCSTNVLWHKNRHTSDFIGIGEDGKLTEVEIKMTWEKFLADIDNIRDFNTSKISRFFMCVPLEYKDDALHVIYQKNIAMTSLIAFDKNGVLSFYPTALNGITEKERFMIQKDINFSDKEIFKFTRITAGKFLRIIRKFKNLNSKISHFYFVLSLLDEGNFLNFKKDMPVFFNETLYLVSLNGYIHSIGIGMNPTDYLMDYRVYKKSKVIIDNKDLISEDDMATFGIYMIKKDLDGYFALLYKRPERVICDKLSQFEIVNILKQSGENLWELTRSGINKEIISYNAKAE